MRLGVPCVALGLPVLSACAPAKVAPSQPAQSRPALPAQPSAAQAPSKPPAGSAPLLASPPAQLPAELAAQVTFLADVCAVALHTDAEAAHGMLAGCRSCPPFDDAAALPDGKIALDGESFFALELLVPGHFTDSLAVQRLAVFNGCESHPDNWGGTVLAERRGEHFQSRAYFSGLRPHACQTYRRPDGRDIAICEYADAHQSIATDTLSVIDFSPTPPDERALLTLTSQDLCMSAPGTRSSTDESIASFELAPGSLTVHIARTTHVLNDQYRKYCDERSQSEALAAPPPSKRELVTRRFRYDGRKFVAQ